METTLPKPGDLIRPRDGMGKPEEAGTYRVVDPPDDVTWVVKIDGGEDDPRAIRSRFLRNWERIPDEESLCESPLELAFLREMRKSDLLVGFMPNVEVLGGRYRIDFADERLRIGIEIDGYEFHSSKESFIKDRQRERELEVAGWRLVRFAGSEVTRNATAAVRDAEAWVNTILNQLHAGSLLDPATGRAALGGRARRAAEAAHGPR